MFMNDYLSFRKFVTPAIIQVIFWVGIACIVVVSLMMMVGASLSPYGGGGMILMGLLYLVFGSFFWRVWCELMLIVFRIYDELHLLRTGRAPEATAPPTS
jgi:uncharacterized membrane protein